MGTISKELRKVRRKVGLRTGVIREVPFAKMHECTLQLLFSRRALSGATTTHPAEPIVPCPHQIIGDAGAIRGVPPIQPMVGSKLVIPTMDKDRKAEKERTRSRTTIN